MLTVRSTPTKEVAVTAMNNKRKPVSYYGVMFVRDEPRCISGPSGKRNLATGEVFDIATIGDLRGWKSIAAAMASIQIAIPLAHVDDYAFRVYERRGDKLTRAV